MPEITCHNTMKGLHLLLFVSLIHSMSTRYTKRNVTMFGRPPVPVIDVWPSHMFDNFDYEGRLRELEAQAQRRKLKGRSAGFCQPFATLTVYAFYDDHFQTRFGGASVEKIETLFGIMNTMIGHESLVFDIDGTTFGFQVKLAGAEHLSGSFHASGESLDSFGYHVRDDVSLGEYHLYMMFTSRGDQAGVIGIANMYVLCVECPGCKEYRVAISEYYINDIITAETAVHELGHNWGADHDFIDHDMSERYAASGELCTHIGGYMDYDPNPFLWSRCTVEDVTAFMLEVIDYFGTLCFPTETCVGTTSTPATTTPTKPPRRCNCRKFSGRKRSRCCKRKLRRGKGCCRGCRCNLRGLTAFDSVGV